MRIIRGEAEGDSSTGEVAVCLEAENFVAEGLVPMTPAPRGARELFNIRSGIRKGCERIVIDLRTEEGTPQSPGDVRAEVLRELGVVRIELRDVVTVAPRATEAILRGRLAKAVYSVSAPAGEWTFVDIHLGNEAEAAVSALSDPARVVVDLRPGGGSLPPPPVSGDRVVVLEPRHGSASYPLTVNGYSRTFEANVVVRLEQRGEEIETTFTTATAWVDAWGHFSTTVHDGPPGAVRLHVGEYSARDGTWEGVVIELDMQR
ncbi:MAG: Gmad2 immunoglobulin-like domain-containing protein [Acidobacteria bacterium]|nr:Gmad2 immunoglobulin-like domain-containing protein [Acidobacteriota bacterium]